MNIASSDHNPYAVARKWFMCIKTVDIWINKTVFNYVGIENRKWNVDDFTSFRSLMSCDLKILFVIVSGRTHSRDYDE